MTFMYLCYLKNYIDLTHKLKYVDTDLIWDSIWVEKKFYHLFRGINP